MNYTLKKVKQVKTVESDEAANHLLDDGWTLLEIMMNRGGQSVSYVLGRRFEIQEVAHVDDNSAA